MEKKKSKKSTQRFFVFFPQAQKDPECIKRRGFRVIGNTSVVATRASLSRSFVYNLISAVFELCFTRVTSILKANKSKGHSLLGIQITS